jgi:hypothetical protein
VQRHEYSVDIDASPEDVWEVFWYRGDDRPQHKLGRIEILHHGDEVGEGKIRTCWFRVPKWLLSGGVGRSWEWVTQVKPFESWKYDAIGKPLWSRAEGWVRLEPLDGGARTRIHFTETYHAFNPVLRALFERRVHRFLSVDNDVVFRHVTSSLEWHRARRAEATAGGGGTATGPAPGGADPGPGP